MDKNRKANNSCMVLLFFTLYSCFTADMGGPRTARVQFDFFSSAQFFLLRFLSRHECKSRAIVLPSLFPRKCSFLFFRSRFYYCFVLFERQKLQTKAVQPLPPTPTLLRSYSYITSFLTLLHFNAVNFRLGKRNRYHSLLFCVVSIRFMHTPTIPGQGSASKARAAILREQAQGREGEGKGSYQGGHQGQHRALGPRRCRPREGSSCRVRQSQAGDKTSHPSY